MRAFRYTLVADGSSDRCLLPIIDSVLSEIPPLAESGIVRQFAWPLAPGGLGVKLRRAVEDFPCDVMFIHRDAEREHMATRVGEIRAAAAAELPGLTFVPLVPVRMTEAWLLIDERAIRRAADNPNGRVEVALPSPHELEQLPDPKQRLFDLLAEASEKRGRRLHQFRSVQNLAARRIRVANLIAAFTPLQHLSAFRSFRDSARSAVDGWLQEHRVHPH